MHVSEIDSDLVADLRDELQDKQESCNTYLLQLEDTPDNLDIVHRLFREIHTIKGDVGIMGLQPFIPLLQAIEDVLDQLRKNSYPYTPALGDVLLLTLDYSHQVLLDFLAGENAFDESQYLHISQLVATLAAQRGDQQAHQALEIVQLLAPETAPVPEDDLPRHGEEYFTAEEINEEIAFFMQLSLLIDQRSPYGAGRTSRIFELAMTMNHISKEPVAYEQLQTALYLHDLGMAFIPRKLMSKAGSLNRTDWHWVKNHVLSMHELISAFEVWQEAAEIILHHHERLDGTGYPNGLKGDQICEGAKLLAIVDSFEAITQKRAYQTSQQRPIVRAISEINNHSGILYCPKWVECFNQAVKRLHTKKAIK